MKTILIEVEVPEDYEDVHPQLAAEDFLQRTAGWGWRLVPERAESPASGESSSKRKTSRPSPKEAIG